MATKMQHATLGVTSIIPDAEVGDYTVRGWTSLGTVTTPSTFPMSTVVIKRALADFTSTSTARIAVPDLTIASLPAGSYEFEWDGGYTCAATTYAVRHSVLFGGTVTDIDIQSFVSTSVSTVASNSINANDTSNAPGVAGAAATVYQFVLRGTFKTTTAGALTPKFGVSAAGTAVMKRGSSLSVIPLA